MWTDLFYDLFDGGDGGTTNLAYVIVRTSLTTHLRCQVDASSGDRRRRTTIDVSNVCRLYDYGFGLFMNGFGQIQLAAESCLFYFNLPMFTNDLEIELK